MILSGFSASLTSSLSSSLTKSAAKIQNDLATQTTELSTGKLADTSKELGGRIGEAMNLHQNLASTQAMANANANVSNFMSTAQTALSSIQSTAHSAQQQILGAITDGGSPAAIQAIANQALQSILSTLNTNVGGQYLFAGQNTGAAPMLPYSQTPPSASQTSIDQGFQSVFGTTPQNAANSSITPQAMQNFLSGAFASQFSSSNWNANWSQASNAPLTAEISPGQTVAISVSANDSGIQNIIQGLAMAANLGVGTLNAQTLGVVYAQASQALGNGLGQLATTQGAMGNVQSDTTFATDSLNAQARYFQTCIGNIEDVDPSQLSANIASLTTQLEATYSLTHLMSQLSLTNYISASSG